MKYNPLVYILVFALYLAVAPGAVAQTTGVISGVILDSAGGVLTRAEVTITRQETGQVRREITDGRGRYTASGLPVGSYEVRAALEGFRAAVRKAVTLSMGRSVAIDLILEVGGSSDTIIVTSAPPLVDAMTSQVSGLVQTQQIEDLPLNGRDFTQLVAFQAGVATPPVSGGGTTKLSISGGRPYETSFLLDGTDISRWDGRPGGVSGLMLGVDTIQELMVLTNSFSSEYGGAGVSMVSSVTRSEQRLPGTAYYYAQQRS
jgi:hypothetical protein